MIFKSRPLLLWFLGCLFTATLPAQTPTPAPTVAPVAPKTGFRTFGWQTLPTGLFYDVVGKPVPIEIFDSARSDFYKLPLVNPLVLYKIIPDAEGKPTHVPVAQVDLSKAGRWPLLIFLPNQAAPTLSIVAISDDLEAFPAPCFNFINLTRVSLDINLGKAKSSVGPGILKIVDPAIAPQKTTPETRYITVAAFYAEKPHMFYSNNWVVYPSQRTLVIIFAEEGLPQIHRIADDVTQYEAKPSVHN